jgi:DNA-binding XRE family transcriptional regulator
MVDKVTFKTVGTPRNVKPASVKSNERGRPLADLVEEFERDDASLVRDKGLSSAAMRAGIQIRAMRKKAGLSQAELGRKIGATQARISELEAGLGVQGPTYDVLERIAAACGMSIRIAAAAAATA